MDLSISDVRAKTEERISSCDWAGAKSALEALWRQQPSSASASYITTCKKRIRPAVSLVPGRLAILRSFTLEPAVPLIEAAAFLSGIDLTIELSPFNAYVQQILDPQSRLYAFGPTVMLIAVQTRDIAPELWDDDEGLSGRDRQVVIDRVCAEFELWIDTLRLHSTAHVIVHNLEQPALPGSGLLDQRQPGGQRAAIAEINGNLERIAEARKNVYVLDYDALVSRQGRDRWHDERKWQTMRIPLRAESLPLLASEWLRFLHPLTGRIGKVLVTDLDNTLWGGVIGEDGVDGIKVGGEYPGAAFKALQKAILDQHRKGVLLAIASKNNPEDVAPVFAHHPGMLLKSNHFVAQKVSWTDKATSLREIAAELSVGLDSLVFLDDNPVERELIRLELPEVTVIELPADPTGYARAVRDCPMFERLSISSEDLERSNYYSGQQLRQQLQQSSASLEDFYRSLNQTVEIAALTDKTLTRAAQLTQKTNQFNLTTRRYSETEIAELAARPDSSVCTVRVKDRFGDNGIVGLCITSDQLDMCSIDTFLLSCRVIGRTVETAVLSFVVEQARRRGARRISGRYLPTRKNSPSASFYREHGFSLVEERDGTMLWSMQLEGSNLACPPWIELVVDEAVFA